MEKNSFMLIYDDCNMFPPIFSYHNLFLHEFDVMSRQYKGLEEFYELFNTFVCTITNRCRWLLQ